MNTQSQELLRCLLERAEGGEHLRFRYIRTWSEYFAVICSKYSVWTVIKNLQSSADMFLKKYCKTLRTPDRSLVNLVVSKTLSDAVEFYREECWVLSHMLGEYQAYITSGNFLNSILLRRRPEEKLWDHRRD